MNTASDVQCYPDENGRWSDSSLSEWHRTETTFWGGLHLHPRYQGVRIAVANGNAKAVNLFAEKDRAPIRLPAWQLNMSQPTKIPDSRKPVIFGF